MREKLVRFAEVHHADFRILSQRTFRHPTEKALRKFRTVLGRMDFLFWLANGGSKRSRLPISQLRQSVRTLCDIEGAIAIAADQGVNATSLKNMRKKCRRDIRQFLLPKNQKAMSARITKLITALSQGQGLKTREKVGEVRDELSRWSRKDITPARNLERLEISLERARHLLDVSGKSVDTPRALLKALHKTSEWRTLRLSHADDERIKRAYEKALHALNGELEEGLQFLRKKLKGV